MGQCKQKMMPANKHSKKKKKKKKLGNRILQYTFNKLQTRNWSSQRQKLTSFFLWKPTGLKESGHEKRGHLYIQIATELTVTGRSASCMQKMQSKLWSKNLRVEFQFPPSPFFVGQPLGGALVRRPALSFSPLLIISCRLFAFSISVRLSSA